jgi:hypothetical protein
MIAAAQKAEAMMGSMEWSVFFQPDLAGAAATAALPLLGTALATKSTSQEFFSVWSAKFFWKRLFAL